jgi:hypothetical protein
MLSATKGKAGRQLTVTQQDWDEHGEMRDVPSTRLDDLRQQVVQ